jgi:hypothetical protein
MLSKTIIYKIENIVKIFVIDYKLQNKYTGCSAVHIHF